MKKLLKIVIPIVLAAALLGCSFWYLFIYDRTFTQDMLLHTARFFDGSGSPAAARFFYNMAYELVRDNDAVAIELANQYKEDGNFSKAEYTLHNAIQDGGGSALYIALSKTYVEQGKLQDALKLIDTAPENIQKELEAVRPSTPVANRPDGTLNDYGPISIQADGTLYVNTAGQIPSVKTDSYTGPITLKSGENTIRAIVVGKNGLANQAIFSYTVHGVIEPVVFADSAFEAQVRQQLDLPEGTIYTNQLWDISSFVMPETATNYSDLQYLLYLQKLTIHNGARGQISALAPRTGLVELDLTGTPVSSDELAVIGNLSNLTKLVLSNCGISTTSPLSNLTKLTYLDMQNNMVMDISPLSGMTSLKELYLSGNAINDISTIEAFKSLTHLGVAHNDLKAIDSAFKLTNLTWLDASMQGQDETGGITSIDGVQALTGLTYFSVADNKIADISQLASCLELTELDISKNSISSLEPLKGHMKLMFLNFSDNQVTALPAWDMECNLVNIDGSNNKISTLEPLAGLHSLNNVYMNNNEKISSVDCLLTCHALLLVSVDGTNVKEADALLWYYPDEDSDPIPTGIKVIFDPTKEGK